MKPSCSILRPIALAVALAFVLGGCTKAVETTGNTRPTTSVGTEIDDSVLTTKVRSGLLSDSDVKSFDIKAETRKDEVQLSGFVDSQSQMDRAVLVARGIEGVLLVSNEMSLKK